MGRRAGDIHENGLKADEKLFDREENNMSMQNYVKSCYGFRCSTTDFDRVKAFIEKHLGEKDREIFADCESIEDIEECCAMASGFDYFDASTILAYVIQDEIHRWVEYCSDDGDYACIMMIGGMPWEVTQQITQEEFEKKAGDLAIEFYGNPVKVDWIKTEEWG